MCDCIEQIDAKLAERNSKLQVGFTFGTPDRPGFTFPALTTDKIDKRNRDKMGAIPTFCPFCGEGTSPCRRRRSAPRSIARQPTELWQVPRTARPDRSSLKTQVDPAALPFEGR